MPKNNIIVFDSYFNLTNKSNLIDRQRVYHQRQFKTVEELKLAIVTEWQKLSQRFIDNSINEWRRRRRRFFAYLVVAYFFWATLYVV